MRNYYDIRLGDRTITKRELHGEEIVKAGRYFIAKTLLELGAATVGPAVAGQSADLLGRAVRGHQLLQCQPHQRRLQEPAHRRHQGGQRRRQLQLWPRPAEDRRLHAARRLARLGGDPLQEGRHHRVRRRRARTSARATSRPRPMLHAKYGKKVTIALCGPVGEYQGLLAGIAFSDKDGRPARLSARGGVGAVMGAKKVKAIVVDLDKIPPFSEPKKVNAAIKDYAKMLQADAMVTNFYQQDRHHGHGRRAEPAWAACPCATSAPGQLADVSHRRDVQDGRRVHQPAQQLARRRADPRLHARLRDPVQQHLRGRQRQGSGLAGRVRDARPARHQLRPHRSRRSRPAQLHRQRPRRGHHRDGRHAGRADGGRARRFGDVEVHGRLPGARSRSGTEKGRIWAQGTARVGEHYKVKRVPVIKKQAISAYDPRVVEATGITMMATAQGADHTAGNLPRLKTREMEATRMIAQSLAHQARVAANDSLGLCIFGMSVTKPNYEFIINAINAAHGTSLTPDFFEALGRDDAAAGARVQPPGRLHRARTTSSRRSSTPSRCRRPTTWRASTRADVHGMYERLPA